ncbi:class IV adenylate cyclase [Streptomyces roseirectus]|uniref:Class IV adenylate cyclase n=1 Tax=Streptomyces roseirectus TaxID=2768066 RepID=A0A7H0IFD4_9ACTN|nr:class IV adenylate cyclase [Streptomyces roseirectus]QNP71500.1 class IV adenylate cyclase [Streptomyces roseirectus]
MPVEAELKARVRVPGAVERGLGERAVARVEVYRDTYYDRVGGELGRGDEELRIRTVEGVGGRRTVLTWKGAAVDEASGSKPEYETEVADAEAAHAILRGLGYVVWIAFEKRCRNYEFTAYGREMLATLVEVPELEGTFLEVETLVEEAELGAALEDVRAVMGELGIGAGELTTETYTGAVAERRGRGASGGGGGA